jgi:hypothetical protein
MTTAPLTPVAQTINTINAPSFWAYYQHYHMVFVPRHGHIDQNHLNRSNLVPEIVD